MRKLTKTAREDRIDSTDEIATISTAELDSEVDPVPSATGISKTLLAAISMLAVTIGIAIYAGFALKSLSDPPVNSQQPTTTAEINR